MTLVSHRVVIGLSGTYSAVGRFYLLLWSILAFVLTVNV